MQRANETRPPSTREPPDPPSGAPAASPQRHTPTLELSHEDAASYTGKQILPAGGCAPLRDRRCCRTRRRRNRPPRHPTRSPQERRPGVKGGGRGEPRTLERRKANAEAMARSLSLSGNLPASGSALTTAAATRPPSI
eukprot:scaffold31867_cov129-Isochrysis_galbana.AAC.1